MGKKGRAAACPRSGSLPRGTAKSSKFLQKGKGGLKVKQQGFKQKFKKGGPPQTGQGSSKQGKQIDQKGAPKLADRYKPSQKILLVGEGNFSFALALLNIFKDRDGDGAGILATAFDTEDILKQKYEDAADIMQELTEGGASVRCGIDATKLKSGLKIGKAKKMRTREEGTVIVPAGDDWKFDRVVFNFPHVGMGIKDQDLNVDMNKRLLAAFFSSAAEVLKPQGEVHVTLKTGKPYELWNVVGMARANPQAAMQLRTAVPFNPEDFPGYEHRRTIGFVEDVSSTANEEIEGRSRTYIFTFATQKNLLVTA